MGPAIGAFQQIVSGSIMAASNGADIINSAYPAVYNTHFNVFIGLKRRPKQGEHEESTRTTTSLAQYIRHPHLCNLPIEHPKA